MCSPTVSVVIPAYNAESTLARAIDSVLAQTRPADEIIVVDDGSDRPLEQRVKQYRDRVKWIRQTNQHAAAARNRGIDAASGTWVAFLDADDYWQPDKLQRQISLLERFPELDVLAGRFYCQAVSGTRSLPHRRSLWGWDAPREATAASAFRLGTLMWTSTVMVRRSLLQQNRFTSGLEPAEDRDLWVRLAARGRVYLDSTPLATAVMEPTGISRADIAHDCRQMMRVLDRHRQMLGPLHLRRWRAYVMYRWAANDSDMASAARKLFYSAWLWPFPMTGHTAMRRGGRLLRATWLLRELFRNNVAALSPTDRQLIHTGTTARKSGGGA